MSRTNKKPYSGSKRFDSTCRNHGSCPHCSASRQIQDTRAREAAKQDLCQCEQWGDVT